MSISIFFTADSISSTPRTVTPVDARNDRSTLSPQRGTAENGVRTVETCKIQRRRNAPNTLYVGSGNRINSWKCFLKEGYASLVFHCRSPSSQYLFQIFCRSCSAESHALSSHSTLRFTAPQLRLCPTCCRSFVCFQRVDVGSDCWSC
jgi:hypothetical protein